MNRYDMQDLIIEDELNKDKKPKRVLAIVALVIIILVAGMTIMKSVVGSNDTNSSKSSKNAQTVDSELQPVDNPIKVKNPAKDDTPDELKPISDDELPTIPLPISKHANIDTQPEQKKAPTPVATETPKEKTPPKETTKSTPIKAKETPHIIKKVKKEHKKVEKKEPKRVTKPSELFKKSTSVVKSAKSSKHIYYIQVGSFSKAPQKSYLDNIKAKGYSYKLFRGGRLIKVRVGPYSSYEEAKSKLPQIKASLGLDGFVVKVK